MHSGSIFSSWIHTGNPTVDRFIKASQMRCSVEIRRNDVMDASGSLGSRCCGFSSRCLFRSRPLYGCLSKWRANSGQSRAVSSTACSGSVGARHLLKGASVDAAGSHSPASQQSYAPFPSGHRFYRRENHSKV